MEEKFLQLQSLEFHQKFANNSTGIKMSTAFRPDKAILIANDGYNAYLDTLGDVSGLAINTYADLQAALRNRIEYFNANGCQLCDHGLDQIYFENYTESEVNAIFKKKRENRKTNF